jgi:uncharacterized protein with FMN-binding domain
MPRSITALLVTIVAVTLLVSFHASPTHVTVTHAPPAADTRAGRFSRATPSAGAHRRHAAPPRSRRVVGAAVEDPYGTVQVAVTLKGGRITDVQPVAIPLDSGRSQEINTAAAPLLRSEVLRAQSAQVDVISGATYTSQAYAQSLQAALDRAGA